MILRDMGNAEDSCAPVKKWNETCAKAVKNKGNTILEAVTRLCRAPVPYNRLATREHHCSAFPLVLRHVGNMSVEWQNNCSAGAIGAIGALTSQRRKTIFEPDLRTYQI